MTSSCPGIFTHHRWNCGIDLLSMTSRIRVRRMGLEGNEGETCGSRAQTPSSQLRDGT